MGNCLAVDENKRMDQMYNTELQRDQNSERHIKKLLLLGPGNSGKSTFIKQLMQIHGTGFSEKHIADVTQNIYHSVLLQMKLIIINCKELGYTMQNETLPSAEYISQLPRDVELNEEIANHISKLWKDEAIQKAFENRKSVGIVDSSPYFFKEIQRIGKVDYRPTEQDILLVRWATTGVNESRFEINKHKFRIFDVGGQRSERSKWIHCFDSVTAVIFVASLACYDLGLFEEETVNAMIESLNLFEEVCNSRWFKRTSMILFLNKSDLFEDKITKKPLSICFPEYQGENNFESGVEYIRNKFLQKNGNQKQRQIYTHVTCGIDRDNVERVFNDVQHIVVQNSLARGGLL